MTLVTRELEITYGSLVVGKGTSYIIDGKFTLTKSYQSATVAFPLLVTSATESGFATACNAVEAAFRIPRQILTVKFNSQTHETYSPAANTGFDMEPSIRKAGGNKDTGRSRLYEVSISFTLPADLSGQNGRQSSSVNLMRTDSNRMRLQVNGVYTALGSNTAREQYDASIAAYIAVLTTAFGGTWEGPFDEQAVTNDTTKNLHFSRVYEQLIYNQSSGILDNTTLRRQRLHVSRSISAPGDAQFASDSPHRLETISIDYSVAVDATVTTGLKSVYSGTIRPFLLALALDIGNGGSQGLVQETVDYDEPENRIAVQMSVLSAGPSNIVMANVRVDDSYNTGRVLIPTWEGERFAKHVFQGPATLSRTITIMTRELGSAKRISPRPNFALIGGSDATQGLDNVNGGAQAPVSDDGSEATAGIAKGSITGDPLNSPDGGRLLKAYLGRYESESPSTIGYPDGPQLEAVDRMVVKRYEYYVKAQRPAGVPSTTSSGGNDSAHPAGTFNPPHSGEVTGGGNFSYNATTGLDIPGRTPADNFTQ